MSPWPERSPVHLALASTSTACRMGRAKLHGGSPRRRTSRASSWYSRQSAANVGTRRVGPDFEASEDAQTGWEGVAKLTPAALTAARARAQIGEDAIRSYSWWYCEATTSQPCL